MKRHGNLKSLWCNYDSLLSAWYEVRQNKTCYHPVLLYELNLAVNLSDLLDRLDKGTYKPRPLRSFYVYDPKTRLIEAPYIEDRIVQHSLLNVLRPLVECRFIDTSYACRINKGTHASNNQLKSYLVNYKNHGYYLKIDIEKFFYSIDHQVLEKQISSIIKCQDSVKLLRLFFENETGKGLPLGNVTSQLLANLSLNPVDHFIKRELKFRHYVRYMDDLIILSDSKEKLKEALLLIKLKIEEQNLRLNSKTKISKIEDGIDFVGYRTWYNRRIIRKRSLYKIKRKLKQDANLNRISSFLSHSMNTNSIVYVIKQILTVKPDLRPWIEEWYRKHIKQKPS